MYSLEEFTEDQKLHNMLGKQNKSQDTKEPITFIQQLPNYLCDVHQKPKLAL